MKLLNRQNVRAQALLEMERLRPGCAVKRNGGSEPRFTRVGPSFFEAVEGAVYESIRKRCLDNPPSVGRTIR